MNEAFGRARESLSHSALVSECQEMAREHLASLLTPPEAIPAAAIERLARHYLATQPEVALRRAREKLFPGKG